MSLKYVQQRIISQVFSTVGLLLWKIKVLSHFPFTVWKINIIMVECVGVCARTLTMSKSKTIHACHLMQTPPLLHLSSTNRSIDSCVLADFRDTWRLEGQQMWVLGDAVKHVVAYQKKWARTKYIESHNPTFPHLDLFQIPQWTQRSTTPSFPTSPPSLLSPSFLSHDWREKSTAFLHTCKKQVDNKRQFFINRITIAVLY